MLCSGIDIIFISGSEDGCYSGIDAIKHTSHLLEVKEMVIDED